MRVKKWTQTLVVALTCLTLPIISTISAADQIVTTGDGNTCGPNPPTISSSTISNPAATLNWDSTNAHLGPKNSLQLVMTPLSVGSNASWRGLNFQWKSKNGITQAGQIGFDCYNGGVSHNFLISISQAVDERNLMGYQNEVNCDERNPQTIGGKTYFQAVCYANNKLIPGHSYKMIVFNHASLGPTWYDASLEDLQNGNKLTVGSIDIGDVPTDQTLQSVGVFLRDDSPVLDCTNIPVQDTVISDFAVIGDLAAKFSNPNYFSHGGCVNSLSTSNLGPIGGWVLKYGGSDPKSRNLENAPVQSFSKSTPTPTPEKSTSKTLSPPKNLTFSYSNGKVQLSIDLPSLVKDGITNAFLVAPDIGYSSDSPLPAVLNGSKGLFSITVDKYMEGKTIPIQIFAANREAKSEPLSSAIAIPVVSSTQSKSTPKSKPIMSKKDNKINPNQFSVPDAPTNPGYKLSGNQVIVSVDVNQRQGANATGAILLAPSLGFTQSNPAKGKISGRKASFNISLSKAMAGKTAQIDIYLTNEIGSSIPLAGQVILPPVINDNVSTQVAKTASVACSKGAAKRTFTGSACPPGWTRS
jgi:hypothetical protein